jgi:molecular chaperone GrpE
MEAEESQPIEPSIPAGEPEAPVGPAVPAEETDEDAEAPREDGREEEGHGARQLERDLDELTAKAQKADEYLELAQRTRADFENYRKRAAREAAAAQERGVVKLVRELLPAVDNLDRALEAAAGNGGSTDELLSGIKLVHAEVIAALNRAGVELYSPAGERFDPTRHEAVAQQPVDGADPGTVVEVYQRGCRLGESVIRPARVVVAG